MTILQKVIKTLAIALAIALSLSIIAGIVGGIGLLGGLFSRDNAVGEMTEYTVSDGIRRLEIDINAADFTVKQGDKFSVRSNLEHLTVEDRDGTLVIKEADSIFGYSYNGAVLELCIPEQTLFESVKLNAGAGKLTVECIAADSVDFDFGAGEVYIERLEVSENADIDGGAGKITVMQGSLNDLDFDMGVGELNFTAELNGQSEFDLGVGETNIKLLGEQSDYSIDVEKGIGSITVDGVVIADDTVVGTGESTVDISGGVGAINIKFK